MTFLATPPSETSPLQTLANTPVELETDSSGLLWYLTGYRVPTYASTSLPTCNATSSGSMVYVTGSASGKWEARCNATTWIYPDATTAP